MKFEEALRQEFSDINPTSWYSLAISARNLDKTVSSITGMTVGDSSGNVLYQKFFGSGISDETLLYDRLNRTDIDESGRLDFVLQDIVDIIPTGAYLFSSHASTWTVPLFCNMSEEYPSLLGGRTWYHCDIRALALSCTRYPFNRTEGALFRDWLSWCRLSSRVSLFTALEGLHIYDSPLKRAPTAKVEAIGRAITAALNTEVFVADEG